MQVKCRPFMLNLVVDIVLRIYHFLLLLLLLLFVKILLTFCIENFENLFYPVK